MSISVLNYTKQELLTMGSQIATMGAIIFAAISLFFILLSIGDTQEQVESIKKLVEASNRTVEILEENRNEAKHQSILDSYENGAPFKISWLGCGKSEKWSADGTYQGQFLSPQFVIVNNKDVKTSVPFYVNMDFIFYGIDEKYPNDLRLVGSKYIFNLDPDADIEPTEFRLDEFLEIAEEKGIVEVSIDLEYEYHAYSTITGKNIGLQTKSEPEILAMLKVDENGKWQVQDFGERVICR